MREHQDQGTRDANGHSEHDGRNWVKVEGGRQRRQGSGDKIVRTRLPIGLWGVGVLKERGCGKMNECRQMNEAVNE